MKNSKNKKKNILSKKNKKKAYLRKRSQKGGECFEDSGSFINLGDVQNTDIVSLTTNPNPKFKFEGTKIFKTTGAKLANIRSNKRTIFLTYRPNSNDFKFEGCPSSNEESYHSFNETSGISEDNEKQEITIKLRPDDPKTHYKIKFDNIDIYNNVKNNLQKIIKTLNELFGQPTPEVFLKRLGNVIEFVKKLEEDHEMNADEKERSDLPVSALLKIKNHIQKNAKKLIEKAVVVGCVAAAGLTTVHELLGDTDVPFAAIATGILLVVYNRLQRLGVLDEKIKSSIESVIDRMEYIMKPLKEIKKNLSKYDSIKVGDNSFEQGTRVFSEGDKKNEYIIWKLQDKIIYILPKIFTLYDRKDLSNNNKIIHSLVDENGSTEFTSNEEDNSWKSTESSIKYHILTPFYLENYKQCFLVYTEKTNIRDADLTCERKNFLGNLKKIEIELLNYLVELMEICIRWIKREKSKGTVTKMFSNLGYYEDKINNLSETLNRKVDLFNTTLNLHQYYHLLDIKHQLVSSDIFDPYNIKHILTLLFNTYRPLNKKIDTNTSIIEESLRFGPVASAVSPVVAEAKAVSPRSDSNGPTWKIKEENFLESILSGIQNTISQS